MSRLSGREQAVWDKRNAGLTFKQIAKDLGLCPATVSFAYRKAYRKIEYENERLKPTELEVYKRALEITCNTLEQKYMFAQDKNTRKIIPLNEYFLNEARKEVEE
mgnify:CR=1 FL=1|jgi:DNA-binding NarL/FixJ family response regulator